MKTVRGACTCAAQPDVLLSCRPVSLCPVSAGNLMIASVNDDVIIIGPGVVKQIRSTDPQARFPFTRRRVVRAGRRDII
ncbi:hypothetical protein EVAR_94753_1 [Eumeta japonica]|uniref:Uncharacterized protein n=1 Tax=Eumeta variegata TaxID=151549 RepID=A0A4C1UX59_EUMVA|nr:hypothetical protein EVAR_94753_1 [Eumeta japonica]